MLWLAIQPCKISSIDTPNQILTKSKVMGYYVFNILEHFCQTKKYIKINLLFLIALHKVEK